MKELRLMKAIIFVGICLCFPIFAYGTDSPDDTLSLKVYFRLNMANVDGDYRDNSVELSKFFDRIGLIRKDTGIVIKKIIVETHASPSGEVEKNERLAEKRALNLGKYLESRMGLDPSVISLVPEGENWKDLYDDIKGRSLEECPWRSDILALIENYGLLGECDLEKQKKCKKTIRLIDDGRAWKWMVKTVFPDLRYGDGTLWIEGGTGTVTVVVVSAEEQLAAIRESIIAAAASSADVALIEEIFRKFNYDSIEETLSSPAYAAASGAVSAAAIAAAQEEALRVLTAQIRSNSINTSEVAAAATKAAAEAAEAAAERALSGQMGTSQGWTPVSAESVQEIASSVGVPAEDIASAINTSAQESASEALSSSETAINELAERTVAELIEKNGLTLPAAGVAAAVAATRDALMSVAAGAAASAAGETSQRVLLEQLQNNGGDLKSATSAVTSAATEAAAAAATKAAMEAAESAAERALSGQMGTSQGWTPVSAESVQEIASSVVVPAEDIASAINTSVQASVAAALSSSETAINELAGRTVAELIAKNGLTLPAAGVAAAVAATREALMSVAGGAAASAAGETSQRVLLEQLQNNGGDLKSATSAVTSAATEAAAAAATKAAMEAAESAAGRALSGQMGGETSITDITDLSQEIITVGVDEVRTNAVKAAEAAADYTINKELQEQIARNGWVPAVAGVSAAITAAKEAAALAAKEAAVSVVDNDASRLIVEQLKANGGDIDSAVDAATAIVTKDATKAASDAAKNTLLKVLSEQMPEDAAAKTQDSKENPAEGAEEEEGETAEEQSAETANVTGTSETSESAVSENESAVSEEMLRKVLSEQMQSSLEKTSTEATAVATTAATAAATTIAEMTTRKILSEYEFRKDSVIYHRWKRDSLFRKPILSIKTNLLVPAMNVGLEVAEGTRWSTLVEVYYPWAQRNWMNTWFSALNTECLQFQYAGVTQYLWIGKSHRNTESNRKYNLKGHAIGLSFGVSRYDIGFDGTGGQGEVGAIGLGYRFSLPLGKGGVMLDFEVAGGYETHHEHRYLVGKYDPSDPNAYSDNSYGDRGRKTGQGLAPVKAAISLTIPIVYKKDMGGQNND